MEGRRRVTLFDQMTAGNSSSRESLASLMLDDVVFNNPKTEAEDEAEGSRKLGRSRTLQDIIREDEPNKNHNNAKDRNKPWKAFKDKLRLKRATVSENNNNNNNSGESTQLNAAQQQQNDVVEEDGNNSDLIIRYGSPVENPAAGGESSDEEDNNNNATAVAGVPLMDLLEETEQEMDLYRASDNDNDDDNVEEYEKEGEREEDKRRGAVEYNCCVCMVRHKGAAFIPCGHTFCRMCSREIWVSRGNCPLCNNLILEILDIF